METIKRILVINLGSTSSKLAYCENETIVRQVETQNDTKCIRALTNADDVTAFFGKQVDDFIREAGIDLTALDAIAVRGMGKSGSYRHGAYRLTKQLLNDVIAAPIGHVGLYASTVIGGHLSERSGVPAFLYDVVPTDEVMPIARITGIARYQRHIASHTLNCRAVARRAALQMGKDPGAVDFIITHMGGGFGTFAYHGGTIIETYSAEEGSFTPERPGRIPASLVSALYTDPSYTPEDIRRILKKDVGLFGWLGTSDCIEVERRIEDGDEKARLVYEAMAYQVSKDICSLGAVFCGKVDAVILTGGIAHSKRFTGWIEERVGFLAPVLRMPGSYEIEALAGGVARVLRGEEPLNDYNEVKPYCMFKEED